MTSRRSSKGRGELLHHVGGGDEHDAGEVEGHVQVVVDEVAVLLRVEDFQEHGGGIAAEVLADLVDFVQHEDGVPDLQAFELVDDAAGHGAHVSAPVAAQFGFVPEAGEGEAHELALQGLGDGPADGGLADARGAGETEDGAAVHLQVPFLLDDLPHRGPQFVQFDGLGEVVGRALLQGVHRGAHRGVAGDHDDFGVGGDLLDGLEELDDRPSSPSSGR